MFGGFKIQGRTAEAAMKILEDALAIEDAGCFMLEFEAVPAKIARLISEQLTIPTIGIGAGVGTDGQILLCHDLLGVFTDFKPKFTKRLRQTDRSGRRRNQAIRQGGEGGLVPGRRSFLRGERGGIRKVRRNGRETEGRSDVGRLPATALRQPRSSVRQTATPRGAGRGAARETLTEQAYRLVEEQIVTLRLKPGDVLSEQMLSAMFKIGRTPIREACSGWRAKA